MINRREWFEIFQPISKGDMPIALGNDKSYMQLNVATFVLLKIRQLLKIIKRFENTLMHYLFLISIKFV